MREYSILYIRPEARQQAEQIEGILRDGFEGAIEWTRVEALFDGLRILQERSFDLILSDLFLADGHGPAAVQHLNQQAPQTPVILLCNIQDRKTAVEAVRKGARAYLCYEKIDPAKLCRTVTAALKPGGNDEAEPDGADRRTNSRFPCRLAVSYRALEHPFLSGVATSETLNISSKGLLFPTQEVLQAGQLFQVSVDWPARLENQVPLKLVAEGRIVRHLNGLAAMRIDKYEFRTRRAATQNSTDGGAATGHSGKSKPSSRPHEAAPEIASRPGMGSARTRRDV
jgi:DNA-binding NarL/FixJ family response regulator